MKVCKKFPAQGGWGLGRREIQEGGEVCMADLHCCTAETNTTLKSNYPLIKKKTSNTCNKYSYPDYII